MVKSVSTKGASNPKSSTTKPRPSKPKPSNVPSSSASASKDKDADRPVKKARVEIGGASTSTSTSTTKPAVKSKDDQPKPLKSALKNSNANTNAKPATIASTEEKPAKGKKQAAVVATKPPAIKAKGKGKRKADDIEVDAAAEPVAVVEAEKEKEKNDKVAVEVEAEVDADTEMQDDDETTTTITTNIESAYKQKIKKSASAAKSKASKIKKQAPAPPLPKTFKVVAGSYEKLLYGLQGSVSLNEQIVDDSEEPSTSESTTPEFKSTSPYTFHLKPIFIFPAHVSCIKAVAASPQGGKWLATGSADEIIKVWDLKRRKEVGGLMHHQGSITTLLFPSRSHLLSASEDGTLALFRARDWTVLRTLKGHKGRVNDIAVHPTGKVALSVGKDGVLRMWDLMRGKGVGSTRLGGKKVEGVEGSGWKEGECVVWAVGGGVFAVQSGKGVDVYATNMELLHHINHTSRIHNIKFVLPVGVTSSSSSSSTDKELLLVAAEDGKVTIYEINTSLDDQDTEPRVVGELVGHSNRVKEVETIRIALPSPTTTTTTDTTTETSTSTTPSAPEQSTTLACTVSSDGFIHIYDLSPISLSSTFTEPSSNATLKPSIVTLRPVAKYDTNKTRLTCITVADGEVEGGVIGGKRKRGGEDSEEEEDEGDEEEEEDNDEGNYGEGDEEEEESGEDEEEGEEEGEDEEENEMESD